MSNKFEILEHQHFTGINVTVDDDGVHFGLMILNPKAPRIIDCDDFRFELTDETINQNRQLLVIETGFDFV